MKKLLVILTIITSGCTNKLYVPLSDVKTMNQSDFVILGTNELKVVVSDVKFNPSNGIYTVKGFTDLLSNPDRKYSRHPNIDVLIAKDGDTAYLTRTKKWGQFKIKMRNIDTSIFIYEQNKILTIDPLSYP